MSDRTDDFRREAERLQAEVQRFTAGHEESTSVRLPDGSAMRVEKVTGPGEGLRFEGFGGLSGRSYAAAAERPPDYPAALPFVPGAAVLIQQLPSKGVTMLFWSDVPDALGAHAAIEKQLLQEGWARGESQDLPQAAGTATSYSMGAVERTLMGGGPVLMLMEKRP